MFTASPLPFVRYHRNVCVVPFVPTRLSFAVLVQDALRRLDAKRKLGPKDVVAVQLPPRVGPAYEEALARLPTVTQVIQRDRSGRLVDAWPVTPCDARVEAVRSARERRVAVAYVDTESRSTPPWHGGNAWPPASGWTAVARGASAWLSLLSEEDEAVGAGALAHHIAGRLEHLRKRFRRVVAICRGDVTRRLFASSTSSSSAMEDDSQASYPDLVLQTPSVGRVLGLLDEFPRLVERWDRAHRPAGGTPGLSRDDLLQDEIRYYDQHHGPRQGIRRYQAWRRMVAAWIARTDCPAVNREDFVRISEACFGKFFTSGLRRHLLGYYDQVDPSRIAPDGDVSARAGGPIELAADDGDRDDARASVPDNSFLWPPWKHLHDELRRQVGTLLNEGVRETSSWKFVGSLDDGIDVRRWLRELASGSRTLYVRRHRQVLGQSKTDGWDPIVWLFEGEEGEPGPHSQRTCRLWVRGRASGRFGSVRIIARPGLPRFLERGSRRRATLYRCYGAVSYAPALCSEVEAQAALGDELDRRVPQEDAFWRHWGRDRPLLDRLIDMALPFTSGRVVCVLPEGREPSEASVREAARAGVSLCVLSHAALGTGSIRKLSHYLAVDGTGHPYDQPESPASWIVRRYQDVMNEIWP